MLDIVFGKKSNPQAVESLVGALKNLALEGSLYIGYPVFDVSDESILMDALLVTKEHGVVAFDLSTTDAQEIEDIVEYQDEIYRGLFNKFFKEKGLSNRRELKFDIEVFSFRASVNSVDVPITTPEKIRNDISSLKNIDDEVFRLINAAIQKTSVIKPAKKRSTVKSEISQGYKIREIEKQIANLDKWQKKLR